MKLATLLLLSFALAAKKKKKKRQNLDPDDFWHRVKQTRPDRFDRGDSLNFQLNEAAWYDNLRVHRQDDMNFFYSDSSSSSDSSFEAIRKDERKRKAKLIKGFKRSKRANDKISWRDRDQMSKLKTKTKLRLQKRSFQQRSRRRPARGGRRRRRLDSSSNSSRDTQLERLSSLDMAYSRDDDINRNLRFVSDLDNLDLRYVNPFCSYAVPSFEQDMRKRKRHRRLVEIAKRRRERDHHLHISRDRWHHRDYSNVLYDYAKDDELVHGDAGKDERDKEIADLRRRLQAEHQARKKAEAAKPDANPEPKTKPDASAEPKAMAARKSPNSGPFLSRPGSYCPLVVALAIVLVIIM